MPFTAHCFDLNYKLTNYMFHIRKFLSKCCPTYSTLWRFRHFDPFIYQKMNSQTIFEVFSFGLNNWGIKPHLFPSWFNAFIFKSHEWQYPDLLALWAKYLERFCMARNFVESGCWLLSVWHFQIWICCGGNVHLAVWKKLTQACTIESRLISR